MGMPRPDAYVLPYLALRITFTTEQACEGAPAGPRRDWIACSRRTAGAVKVDWFRSNGSSGNRSDEGETVPRRPIEFRTSVIRTLTVFVLV